jgi:hypothetical protein
MLSWSDSTCASAMLLLGSINICHHLYHHPCPAEQLHVCCAGDNAKGQLGVPGQTAAILHPQPIQVRSAALQQAPAQGSTSHASDQTISVQAQHCLRLHTTREEVLPMSLALRVLSCRHCSMAMLARVVPQLLLYLLCCQARQLMLGVKLHACRLSGAGLLSPSVRAMQQG